MSLSTEQSRSYEECEFCGNLVPIRALICLGCGPLYSATKTTSTTDLKQFIGIRGSASTQEDLIGDIKIGDNGRQ